MRPPVLALLLALGAACSAAESVPESAPVDARSVSVPAPSSTASPTTTTAAPTTTARPTTTSAPVPSRTGTPAPEWLGTRVVEPTPPELVDRRLWTVDVLAPPPDASFASAVVHPPPADVIARSTWREGCPVALDELAYARVSFVGFDGRFHTGELLAHVDHVDELVAVFAGLHELRFPIEEMRVTTLEDLVAPRTGDDNNTTAFVCRRAVGSTSWSRHAHGAAVDLNPFHNPYVRGELVLPELASAYVDRDDPRPGMVTAEVADLFAAIGWGWGGDWSSSSDTMHFSDTGR
jgi:hypothetical protein